MKELKFEALAVLASAAPPTMLSAFPVLQGTKSFVVATFERLRLGTPFLEHQT